MLPTMFGGQSYRNLFFRILIISLLVMVVLKVLLQREWSVVRNLLSLRNSNDCHYVVKPFFRFICDENSPNSIPSSMFSSEHVCDRLYSNKNRSNLFSRVQTDFQPFKNHRILLADIENISKSCLSCHHIQIIQNKLYNVPRSTSFNYETRGRSVKLLIKQMIDTFPNIPNLDLFFHVGDVVDLPDGLNDILLRVPIFAFTKTNRTRKGVRSDGLVLMPCFTFWSWPETRVGRWTETFQSILNAAHKTPYEKRTAKLFWRGTASWKRIRFLEMAAQHTDTMDVAEISWNTSTGVSVYAGSHTYKTLEEHCHYKYLAHLEGNSYSSRLKYLLLCGSTVVYNAFQYWEEYWHHLLKNDENIILFEAAGNEAGVNSKLDWLLSNEVRAKGIGRQGQQIVQDYLNEHAVSCYWWKLLHEYASLLGYQPTLHPNAVYIDDFILSTSP